MDPNLTAVLLGVLSNCLTRLLSAGWEKSGEIVVGRELLDKWERQKTALSPIIESAVREVAEGFEWQGNAPFEEVCLFMDYRS